MQFASRVCLQAFDLPFLMVLAVLLCGADERAFDAAWPQGKSKCWFRVIQSQTVDDLRSTCPGLLTLLLVSVRERRVRGVLAIMCSAMKRG